MVSRTIYLFSIGISVLLCFALVPSGAQAETEIDVESLAEVTFTNYLEWSIYYLFISPSDSEYYGGDVIDTTGATIMAPYDSLLLYMVPGDYGVLILDEYYDIWTGAYSVVDGSEIYFDELSLTYEEPGDADGLISIDIYVDTTASVDYLFLSPYDSESWGVDLLGLGSLANGDTLTITLPEYDENKNYDLLAVFDDGDQVTVAVEAYDGAEFYLVDTIPGDDDDVIPDDDDVVPDDDDVIPDDDDIVTDDDDELPPEQQPGGVSGNKDDIEGEENKDSSAIGIIAIITTMTLFIAIRMYRRKN